MLETHICGDGIPTVVTRRTAERYPWFVPGERCPRCSWTLNKELNMIDSRKGETKSPATGTKGGPVIGAAGGGKGNPHSGKK